MRLTAFATLQREGLGFVDAGARDGVHPLFQEVASLKDFYTRVPQ